ncbi:N-acetylglucosamine kinase [Mycobacterium sp. MS1601]|uniref:N-acetylglucosamine kinase n=1 Tax=Mycobacterium sp. MS1601 TaxID=1936029 RepID=UPI0009796F5B|nr:BadF/BadG/BcrA/BcrD ATPase family protein [Mycobacterium sp. MS1601]AQA06660.1 N-acetylglucosamine kinase [Mycobacterium sp. MS1601]
MACYLGVDGGGSKTAFALIDADGRVRGRATAPSSYYFSHGFAVVEDALRQGISEVCSSAGITSDDIDFAFFGLPGYGEASADLARLDAVPGLILGHDRYTCDNDMVCGWAGSLAGEDGINVVCGTGSMTYGERLGVGRRVGGWGELFGDEGSAYWVATRGLNAFSRMSDGRLSRGPLYELLTQRLQLAGDLDAVSLVIEQWGGDRSSIAALATTVCEAARRGDRVAEGIIVDAAAELVTLIETTGALIGFGEHDRVPVSYSGGMFSDSGFLDAFRRALEQLPAKYDLQSPVLDPATGAALYAAKRAGTPLSANALHQLRTCEARPS